MTKEERIKYTVDELICKGNLNLIPLTFSENYIANTGDKQYHGHRFLTNWSKQITRAIPKIKLVKIEFLLSHGQSITWLRTLTGIHEKTLKGIPATGKKVTWNELVVSRFDGNLIVEEWVVSELMGKLLLIQPKAK